MVSDVRPRTIHPALGTVTIPLGYCLDYRRLCVYKKAWSELQSVTLRCFVHFMAAGLVLRVVKLDFVFIRRMFNVSSAN
jgi:hypothetical protein